jgi:hypothetical protein
MKPIIIGIGHYSRTGKDTFANALVDTLHEMDPTLKVGRKSFASKLKEITHDLYAWAGLQDEAYYNVVANEHERDVVLPALGMTPVEAWVKFGTPAVREQVYDGSWVDYLLKTDHGLDVMIIPDVRFFNEIQAVREADGYTIKLVRDGYGPKMTVADLALIYFKGWDNVIGDRRPGFADGIRNLREWAAKYAARIMRGADLHALDRSPEEIREALAVQVYPTPAEARQVYQDAGLNFEDYTA